MWFGKFIRSFAIMALVLAATITGVAHAQVKSEASDHGKLACISGKDQSRAVACRTYGISLLNGDKASLNRGELLLDTACRVGDSVACLRLGGIGIGAKPGATTTLSEGVYYMRRGCDLNNPQACSELSTLYALGIGVEPHAGVVIALIDKSCRLGDASECATAKSMVAQHPNLRSQIPAIDPSLSVDQQLLKARKVVESGDKIGGAQSVIRLMQEGNEYAEWLLGGWFYYGLDGVFDTSRQADGVILIENAARVGHVEAAIWIGMAYWYGEGVALDRAKGEKYMAIAASRGSQMAVNIYRSMKNEPARQANAARQVALEEAIRQQSENAWKSSWANYEAWKTSPGGSSSTTSYSGPSTSTIMDNANWNQRFNYLSGSTSACPSSNPYCH